jgi:hypothetical protein
MAPNYCQYAAPSSNIGYYVAAPPIQLLRPPCVKWEAGTYLSLKLLAVPGNPDSLMYTMPVCYFDNGTPEEW